jgi:hypothetical protein
LETSAIDAGRRRVHPMFKPTPIVRSHWHHTFEGLQTSALEFYGAVEAAVGRRGIPDLKLSRVEWSESGVLSAKRQYLRIERRGLAFDVCTAPFGNGQFFSSWLAEMVPSPLIGILGFFAYALLYFFLAMAGLFIASKISGVLFVLSVPVVFLGFFVALGGICVAIRDGRLPWEEYVRATPLLGRLYEVLFAADTYYRIDTVTAFQDLAHTAVLECVDGVTAAQGLRALAGDERKSTMRDVVDRRRW